MSRLSLSFVLTAFLGISLLSSSPAANATAYAVKSSAPIIDTTAPVALAAFQVQAVRNVSYGSDPAQKMDIYKPANIKNAPVIFMVHGGGWYRGDKASAGVVENKVSHWVPQGYLVISVNYRLSPAVNPVQEAGDVARALAYAQAHAKSWGGDPARFVLMGHSAGAHLVSLISANPSIASNAGAKPWLGTVALDSAAFNVVQIMTHPHPSLYDDAFGTDKALWTAASPTLVVKTATKPMLLVCSTQRSDSCPQAKDFSKKDTSFRGSAVLFPIDLSHGEIDSNLGLPNALTSRVDTFLRSLGLAPVKGSAQSMN